MTSLTEAATSHEAVSIAPDPNESVSDTALRRMAECESGTSSQSPMEQQASHDLFKLL